MRYLLLCSVVMVSLPAIAQTDTPWQALPVTAPQPDTSETTAPFSPLVDEAGAPVAETPPPAPVAVTPAPLPPAATMALPPAPAKDIFKEALAHAYNYNPVLKAQRETLAALDEGVAQAVSGFRPDIVAGYGKGRQRKALGNTDWNYQDTTGKTLEIDQPIFSGGETWANFKSAKERVKAGRAQLQDVEQQVLYNAVVAYTDVVEKQLVLQLNQHNVDVLKRQLEASNARFDAGELTRTDVSQSQARLAKAQADERQALGDVETARATFKRIVGYVPEGELALPPVPSILPQSLDQATLLAQTVNPLLVAAQYDEKAAESDINARGSALLPDVSVRGTMNRSDNGSINTSGKLDSDAVTLNVTVPLYQSGAEWSRLREARNLANRAKHTTLDTHDAVIETVTRAWQDYNTAKAVIVSTNEATRAAEIALEGVRQENQFGVRTILDVLDAEQEAFSTRVDLVKAERSEKVHAYLLLAAIGRLTAKDLALDVTLYDPKEHYDDVKYQLLGL